ncbi:hypothetical protein KQUDLBSD_CDS0135 [Staphylococcus phage PG-2021_40]
MPMNKREQLEHDYSTYVKKYVHSEIQVPIPFMKFKDKLTRYLNSGKPIIVEDSGFPSTSSNKVFINHVGDRWVGGYSEVYYNGEKIKVPHTIHYSDLYINHPNYKKKIIFIEENPYEKK